MIPEDKLPTVRELWPTFSSFGAKYRIDPKLLLSMGWIQSGLDPSARSSAGALGLMQMMPDTAAEVAARLKRKSFDLTDPVDSIDFGAEHLGRLVARFGLPRLAVAAYVAGAGAVQAAGGQVPSDRDTQRAVRNVMTTWTWLMQNILQLLSEADTAKRVHPTTVTTSASTSMAVPAAVTTSAATGSSTVVVDPGWWLIAPPDNWQNPIPISAAQVDLLEVLAARLNLAFTRDDGLCKVYVGVPRAQTKPSVSKNGLIMPVPGADARNNGAYAADSGLDIMVPVGSPVVAAASGIIVYSEPGHTPWINFPDTGNSLLIALDTPFVYRGRKYGYIWYTHLSRLRFHVPDGSGRGPHVDQGELIGWTGIGNRVPHLHFGVVADRAQTVYIPPFELAAYFGWAKM